MELGHTFHWRDSWLTFSGPSHRWSHPGTHLGVETRIKILCSIVMKLYWTWHAPVFQKKIQTEGCCCVLLSFTSAASEQSRNDATMRETRTIMFLLIQVIYLFMAIVKVRLLFSIIYLSNALLLFVFFSIFKHTLHVLTDFIGFCSKKKNHFF